VHAFLNARKSLGGHSPQLHQCSSQSNFVWHVTWMKTLNKCVKILYRNFRPLLRNGQTLQGIFTYAVHFRQIAVNLGFHVKRSSKRRYTTIRYSKTKVMNIQRVMQLRSLIIILYTGYAYTNPMTVGNNVSCVSPYCRLRTKRQSFL